MLDLSNLPLSGAIIFLIVLSVVAYLSFFLDDIKIKFFDDLKPWK